jgi:bla regulator protein blaR1
MTTASSLNTLFFPALVNHLWQTTAVVAIVWAITSTLRSNSASLRFRFWLLASMKFFLPFSLLITAGQHLRSTTASTAPTQTLGTIVTQAVQPYQALSAHATVEQPGPAAPRLRFAGICLALWFFGACAVLVSWLRSWVSLQCAVRQATLRTTISDVPVLQTRSLLEPGVFGIFRPVLLIPEDMLTRLSSRELDAIFNHELCHVRRRDNLTAALHTLVFAIFWFHPAVWLIKARLLDERELACDEDVVSSGEDPQLYAESILNVCKFYLEAPTTAMAGVTGGELKRRVTRIMSQQTYARLSARRTVMMVLLGAAVLSMPFAAGVINARPLHAQAAEPTKAFEVVSIHPERDVTSMSMSLTQTSWDTTGAPLKTLLYAAFSLKDFQILSAPGWVNSERYTIHARLPEDMSKLPFEQRDKQSEPMLQSMLIDRFHLRYHWTTQELPVYSLVIDKGGPMLPTAAPEDKFLVVTSRDLFEAHAITMTDFADNLGSNLNRIVQDRTGLTGRYTFKLNYPPSANADTPFGAAPSSQTESEGRLFSALTDQLGLKLVQEKRPVRMLVIDDIQRPTPN